MEAVTMNGQSITLKNLHIGFHTPLKNDKTIFGPVDAEVCHGEMVGIIGRNGIGKSTLLRTIAGLQPQLNGEILINGIKNHRVKLKEMAKMISFVSTEQVFVRQIKVGELVAIGRFPHTNWYGKLNDLDKSAIDAAVDQTGIGSLLPKLIHELSDGERQKVMIARALAQDTPVIILDEPTAFLDLPARFEILRILNDLTLKHDNTVLFSTHDLSIAMDVADKLWIMAENQIFQGAPEDLLISKVFRKLFLNSPAEFDVKTFTFRFKRELKRIITLGGDKKYRLLTKRAMERIGFQVADDSGHGKSVFLHELNGFPSWQLIEDDHELEFDSIYGLTRYLKTKCKN
jgi:iron complex transport system ATP-binding protein